MKPHQCDYPYGDQQVAALQKTLSCGRLELYEELANNDEREALVLYCWSIGLCQALYWPLHAFEVTLRNTMADAIADAHGDDWYEDIPAFSSYKGSKPNKEVEHLRKAKEKLDEASRPYDHDNIVAATTLGFWHGLFKQEYESRLYAPLFATFFQVIDREEAYKKVNQIKRLRNNVAHYEPIFVFPDNKKLRELYKDYKLILKMIRWMCPETALWV